MDLLGVEDLTPERVTRIMEAAEAIAEGNPPARLDGRLVVMAFFEPSTRTRLSFESAAMRLGARVLGFSDAKATSSAKGETLEDTARILSAYGDVLVMRHPEKGSAKRAASMATIPVINAGDGAGEHPTQSLLDLYTLRKELGELEGKTITMVGDVANSRTIHTLVPLLRQWGMTIQACSAPGLSWAEGDLPEVSLDEALKGDVAYWTRVQQERLPEGSTVDTSSFRLDRRLYLAHEGKARILHPLPRVDELDADMDSLGEALYFQQAANGVPVRQAILLDALGLL